MEKVQILALGWATCKAAMSGQMWTTSGRSCGISNKGHKIATRKIDLSVVIEMTPLSWETGER